MKLGFNLNMAFGKNSAKIKMKMVEKIVCNNKIEEDPRPAATKKGFNNTAMYRVYITKAILLPTSMVAINQAGLSLK